MKNYQYVGILFVFVIMAAVSVAGCTNTSSPSATATPTATGTTTGTGTATPAATTTTSGSSLTTLGSAVDLSKVHWYEYQMTGSGMTGTTTMREDFGTTYNGQAADKTTMTVNGAEGASTIVMYMDHTSHASLGGTMTTTVNGQPTTMAIPASSSGTEGTTSNPMDSNSNAALTSAGADSVTVPAGTYAATKYTVTETDGSTGTVWIAPGVPIPVKYAGTSAGATVEMDLTGWG
jgi:hypothetical protein